MDEQILQVLVQQYLKLSKILPLAFALSILPLYRALRTRLAKVIRAPTDVTDSILDVLGFLLVR